MKDGWERITSGHIDMAYSWTWLAQLKYCLPEARTGIMHNISCQCLAVIWLPQYTRQNDQWLKCSVLWLTWHTTTVYCQRLSAPFTFKSDNPISFTFTSRRTVPWSNLQSHFHWFWYLTQFSFFDMFHKHSLKLLDLFIKNNMKVFTYSAHSQNTLFFWFYFSNHNYLIQLQCILGSLGSVLISET